MEAIGHVAEMEKQLVGAVEELKAMRQELQGMKENPLKRALQNSVKALEANVAALRERLSELKGAVIEGCKKTLAAFKEHGISALAGAARFFHLKPAITALRGSMEAGIRTDEKALAKIQAVSAEYHEVGRHLKSLGRALMGKEAVQEAKEAGRLAQARTRRGPLLPGPRPGAVHPVPRLHPGGGLRPGGHQGGHCREAAPDGGGRAAGLQAQPDYRPPSPAPRQGARLSAVGKSI